MTEIESIQENPFRFEIGDIVIVSIQIIIREFAQLSEFTNRYSFRAEENDFATLKVMNRWDTRKTSIHREVSYSLELTNPGTFGNHAENHARIILKQSEIQYKLPSILI